ncbi:ABC-type transport system, involved in lipoprotein release, permease component [Acidobacteria bacterium Mor1]|nr:ABC-type transport system, involved in lipoprotein release, permease component [Acidobacteria bacterium Mor1]
MAALDLKMLRELWLMRGQAVAIALVIASGVAMFVIASSTLDSLTKTQREFYEENRFGEVFASLVRAPDSLEEQIGAIDGVATVQTRVSSMATVEIEGFDDPVMGRLVSLPEPGQPALNRLHLRSGRTVDPLRENEVVVSEAFAEAHGFVLGDEISATINGRRKALVIVGVGLSPEFIYQIRPGDMFPDYERYGILWMAHRPLATAYDMEGAFNDVVLTLTARATPAKVIDELDLLLTRYGGQGAYVRADQLSHQYLTQEFEGLESMATVLPTIFLAVAAFLLNVVVNRMVATQRDQIATLKAFGYATPTVALHYTKLIMLVVALGSAFGLGFGTWLGHGLATFYQNFFRFPFLRFELTPRTLSTAVVISAIAAVVGTLHSVYRAAALPPAEGMRPDPPSNFRRTLVERLGLGRMIHEPTRMILRQLERRPRKSLLTVVGIAFSLAIMMVGSFNQDAITYMIDIQFSLVQRDDVAVTFTEPSSYRAMHELRGIPGVLHSEPYRAVPVRLRNGHREERTAIQGVPRNSELRQLIDTRQRAVEVPPDGLLLTDYLADLLALSPGDRVTVEVLEGRRPVLEVPLAGVVSEFIGISAYMDLDALNARMKEGGALSGVLLTVDETRERRIFRELKDIPRISGVALKEASIESLWETMGQTLLVFAFINTILAGSIAFGVVYNSARISLSERERELASLRVLGFTRGEISYILLGELAILTVAAIPVGIVIGQALCGFFASTLASELYRVPVHIAPRTYALACTVILVSAVISALIVRYRLHRLDLIGVLKTRE